MTRKLFKDISRKDIGQIYDMKAKVNTIKQTSGPTLMIMSDGTSNFTFKAFIKPGVRAFPEINIDDYVNIKAKISLRNGSIEAEASNISKITNSELETIKKEISELQEAKFKPINKDFSIKSEVLESLKPRFIKIASLIRKAIVEGRPILLRHDADCDGYSSAICMERAILGFMDEVTNGDKQTQFQNYKRSPSKAPFYEYEDAVKDCSNWLRDKNRNGALPPLVIVTDNGSTSEDFLGMTQMKMYDSIIVVIDHHYPGELDENGKVFIDQLLDGHINPYLTGFDSNVCSGMLGYELARFIYEKNTNSILIPAMASILDHTEGIERDTYVKLAEEAGFTQEYLIKLGEITYLQSHYLRFMEAREFVNDLFGANMKLQKKLVELLSPEIERRYAKVRKIAKHYSKVSDLGPFYLIHFEGEKGTSRGEFPAVGKSTNEIHSMFEKELEKPIITMTSGSTFLTIRVSEGISGFSVPNFCEIITKDLPHTGADGGGHEHAGSIKFVEYGKEEVISAFKNYLKNIADKQ